MLALQTLFRSPPEDDWCSKPIEMLEHDWWLAHFRTLVTKGALDSQRALRCSSKVIGAQVCMSPLYWPIIWSSLHPNVLSRCIFKLLLQVIQRILLRKSLREFSPIIDRWSSMEKNLHVKTIGIILIIDWIFSWKRALAKIINLDCFISPRQLRISSCYSTEDIPVYENIMQGVFFHAFLKTRKKKSEAEGEAIQF